ncbi:PREDICTED: uncharacterized protein LOC108620005 [Drosophila arizonae]|uniref:Uncharacterized protein LOC108620005 n=1 Tax=Drosophila arizonae TaxID=7263 RepID=A0ABM1PYR0_DROAR|nr:PREDICTED: uncharacterized protein LOC108620005 [Drosophila arizonae]
MPFPIHPPKQMPCPHWQHFPISPVDSKPSPFGSSNGGGSGGGGQKSNSSMTAEKPPEPVSYRYCVQCRAAGKDVGGIDED